MTIVEKIQAWRDRRTEFLALIEQARALQGQLQAIQNQMEAKRNELANAESMLTQD